MNIWNWFNEITIGKKKWESFSESDRKNFQPYMIHRILSMDYNLIEISNEIQKYNYLDNKIIYNIYKNILPKRKFWNKYLKSKTEKNNSKELIENLAKVLEISIREAKEYYNIIGLKGTRQILEEQGIQLNIKKKSIK